MLSFAVACLDDPAGAGSGESENLAPSECGKGAAPGEDARLSSDGPEVDWDG